MAENETARCELRPAIAADAGWLEALYEDAMRPHVEAVGAWDPDLFRLTFDPRTTQVVRHDGRDVGMLRTVPRQDGLYLADIQLDASHRRRGIGSRILKQLIAESERTGRALILRCLRGNPARRFYERHGFKVYKSSPDAWFLWRRAGTPQE